MQRRLAVTYAVSIAVGWAYLLATDGAGVGEFSALATLGAGFPPGIAAGVLVSNLPVGPTWHDAMARPRGMVGLKAALAATLSFYVVRSAAFALRATPETYDLGIFGVRTIHSPAIVTAMHVAANLPGVGVAAGAGLLSAHVVCEFCDDVAAL
ncbi:MAG: hypothetical protein ABEJ68_06740 [Halobacteriaceae archaeon]